jgi:predicted permease
MAFSGIRMAVRAAFQRPAVESEMDKEMRLHLEMQVEENARRGMPPDEARRAALIAFGGVDRAKEATRDERSTRWIEEVTADLRMGLRGMRRNPAFTLTVVLLLALGTGANTAIFTVVNELLLNPLPFPGGDRMRLVQASANNGQIILPPERQFAERWRARDGVVEGMIVSQSVGATLGDTTRIPAPEMIRGRALEPGTMLFLGMRPLLGRDIIPADTMAGATPVIILGEKLWKTEFGGDASVVGTRIRVNGVIHTVIGVAPRRFTVPFFFSNDIFTVMPRGNAGRNVDLVVRLKPGVTPEQVTAELATVGPPRANDFGVPFDPVRLVAGGDDVNDRTRRVVLLLFGAVGFVLLIACANVANLLLARAWSRQREFAVRRALGAGRARLLRQVFTESLLFALAGGAAGAVASLAFLRMLIAAQPPEASLPPEARLDGTVLLWTLTISTLTGLLFGIAPALFATSDNMEAGLKSAARSTTAGVGGQRLRGSLVVLEVALSVVLLAGTGLLVRTLVAMQRADLGVTTHGLYALDLRLPPNIFKDSTTRRDVLASLKSRVATIPGVSAVSYVMRPPPEFGAAFTDIRIEGRGPSPADTLTFAEFNAAASDMLGVAGIRIIEGRPFIADPTLSEEASGAEVVINERFAQRYWPDGKAIGSRIQLNARWMTVVGIARNVDIPGNHERRAGLQYYYSLPGAPVQVAVLVRSAIPAARLEAELRRTLSEANGLVRVGRFTDVDASLHESRATHRFVLGLLGVFASLALVLAGVGLHAVISFAVSQRRREIGIRVALGAEPPRIARMVVGQGLALAIGGIAIGVLAAVGVTRSLGSLLYGIEPGDPLTSGAVALILLTVSLGACGLPARRATKVDPVEMLRAE